MASVIKKKKHNLIPKKKKTFIGYEGNNHKMTMTNTLCVSMVAGFILNISTA